MIMKNDKNTMGVTIVMYHYVRDLKRSRYPKIKGLDSDAFNEQLRYILKHYRVIRMQDMFACLKGNAKLPENSLLLTFDDGYKDHFETVFPVLDSLGIQGSFFPPGKAIHEHKLLAVNKIHFILASVEDERLLVKDIYSLMDKYRLEYSLKPNGYYCTELAGNTRFDRKEIVFIKTLLQKTLPEKLRNIMVNQLFLKYVSKSEEAFAKELYMSAEQLKCMYRHGMYIGSHGWDHYWLNTLTAKQQENEVKSSLRFLKGLGCNTTDWAMCYPYGAYNSSLIAVLEKYGCKLGLTTKVEIANLAADNPFALPRLDTNDLPKNGYAAPNGWIFKVKQLSRTGVIPGRNLR